MNSGGGLTVGWWVELRNNCSRRAVKCLFDKLSFFFSGNMKKKEVSAGYKDIFIIFAADFVFFVIKR